MRVSTTMLESFRLFMQPDQEWMPESELLATIRGEFVATPKMMLGNAFGRCLEKPAQYRRTDSQDEYYAVPVKVVDGWREFIFPGSTVAPCLERFDRRGVFEAKTTKQYGDVVVVSKVDQIIGAAITENKATLSQFDFDKYAESSQWRFYLDAFEGASVVTYNVFGMEEDESRPNTFTLKATDSFRMYPYADLHHYCADLVGRFVDYVKARGLVGFLEERQTAWA